MDHQALGIDVTPADRAYAARVVTLGVGHGKHNTICLAKRCLDEKIEGDFVEAGVNMGGHPALMGYVLRKRGVTDRKVHMYDSFRGVPKAGPKDPKEWIATMGIEPDPDHPTETGIIVNPLPAVKENMEKWGAPLDQIVYHEGWFEEVLPNEKNTPEKIALLRIDVDLYHSTEVVLKYLYPRVVKGGYIISDDWGEGEGDAPCRIALFEYLDRMGEKRPTVTRLPDTTGTAWWQKT